MADWWTPRRTEGVRFDPWVIERGGILALRKDGLPRRFTREASAARAADRMNTPRSGR